MEEEGADSPPAAEKKGVEEEDDFGYRLFPDRNKKPQSFLVRSLFTFHNKCQLMLRLTLETNPYARLLLEALKQSGCTVFNDRHFSCENCDGCVSGGFDAATSQIVLCQNNIRQQSHMNRVVTHELIHAFDHCRAHVDWFKNVKHLACSEIAERRPLSPWSSPQMARQPAVMPAASPPWSSSLSWCLWGCFHYIFITPPSHSCPVVFFTPFLNVSSWRYNRHP
ncbi:hypothetical protein Nmel_005707 [Mimus melanotis]